MSYNIPSILNETITILKGILDNADDLALLNVINAKISNLISSKGCLFKQFNNSTPRTMSYYGMCFMNSGSNKDYMVDIINDYIIPFVEEDLKQRVEDYKIEYREQQSILRVGKKEEKKIEEEIEKIRVANFELSNVNYTGLYREAEQLYKMKFGSIFIRIAELGDYLEGCATGDKSKKELYQRLKEVYEGFIAPSIIAGDSKREALKNIPVQVLLYTDYENLFNEKIKEYYISSLKTGMARRSFIYMPKETNSILQKPKRAVEKEQSLFATKDLQRRFKQIYESIKENTIYQLSEEAKELLYQYQCNCIDYFNNSKDNIIVKLEKKESFWKITKLAVVYSVIDNPKNIIVSSKYVQMAIDFYNLISPGLRNVIEKRKKSEIEMYAEYISDHKDDIITRTDLRSLNHVHSSKFKRFWEEHEDEIKEELDNNYNLLLYPYESSNRSLKAYQVMKK